MNRWFKKFPYFGWLTILLVSLSACVFSYHWEKRQYTPEHLSRLVQEDFARREAAVLRDQRQGRFQRFLEGVNLPASPYDYQIQTVRAGKTLSWNSSLADLPAAIKTSPASLLSGRLEKLASGYYFVQSWPLKAADTPVYAFTLIPVLHTYAIENQYFQSRFAAGERIPVSTEILSENLPDTYPVRVQDGKTVFYLHFTETADDIYRAGPLVWVFTFMALLSLIFWIHEFCLGIGERSKSALKGWLTLVLIALILYAVDSRVIYPAGYINTRIFSPELLSSLEGVSSLGDFLISILLDLWLYLYLIAYVPLASVKLLPFRPADKLLRILCVLALTYMLYRELASDMHLLVIDSKISFEVSDFTSLNLYTFIGIFALSAITISFLIVLAIINGLMSGVTRRIWVKYLLVSTGSLLSIYLLPHTGMSVFYTAVMVMAVAGMLLLDTFGLPLQRRHRQYDISIAPTSYLWFAILCSWITLEIFYFNYSKEKELRKIFAQKQEQKDDAYASYTFMDYADQVQKDTVVRAFLEKPAPEHRTPTNNYVFYTYLTQYPRKYSITISYCNRERNPLFPADSAVAPMLRLADSIAGGRFLYGLLNIEKATQGKFMFLGLCPVPAGNGIDTAGYIACSVAADKGPQIMKRQSFLEKKYNPTDQHYFDKYAFSIYRNNVLWTQGGNSTFPYISRDKTPTGAFVFEESLKRSWMRYRPSKEELINVIYDRDLLIDIVSLFSYVLAVLLVLTGCTFLLRQMLFYPAQTRFFLRNFNFTIRSKINLTILVTVFASLFLVGVITLSFLKGKYRENQRKSLQSLLLYYTQDISHFSEERGFDFTTITQGNLLSTYSELSYKLNELAEDQGADINLYNKYGKLVATSQLELVKNGLLSRHMQRDVFDSLGNGEQSEVLMEEKIGDLVYQSIYAPLRDKNDRILAYVNLPYYASQIELNGEISNVVVSLINVYAFIFFLSGICAILISNGIIRSFRQLIDQFRNIRLRHNEYIEWPYKDEIGVLVQEYNAMIRKVEAMAAKLARTEREAAWREIARQVAHEIKNPLTPMKLNIQYLQQAIKSERSDIPALASRVSVTLIEQIENLNLIASEFSNFAKMPESDPELLQVAQALSSLVSLFQKNGNMRVELAEGSRDLQVHMDKSYFIRIFTNLIQNAIQAIAPEKEGLVQVRYEQEEGDVIISVTDNGIGVSAELQEKLFVPYFTTKSSGTGLGLAMTKNMVEHSGGTIWFTTSAQGSIFYVRLPLAATQPV